MFAARGLGLLLIFGATLALAPACAKKTEDTFFQDQDFKPPKLGEGSEAPKFNPNNIADTATLQDFEAFDADRIQKFLEGTPYDRKSFLSTYQSNGVRAGDAIAATARKYRINALAFLVAAQGTQGLIGEKEYPFPPERVEYVFRCGCLQGTDCLPELAGFDRQVDCLGRQLRVALDQTLTQETTTSGWGKEVPRLTLDNVPVDPENEATAVIYDRTPRVAIGQAGGAWFFWNLFNVYALKLGYSGSVGGANGAGWIGDKCVSAASCSLQGSICETDYPGGMCTVKCTGECPTANGKAPAYCASFESEKKNGYCLPVCNLSAASSCRPGYKCATIRRFGGMASDASPVCQFAKK